MKQGIDIMKQEKTEKTMAELQVSLNMEYDWSKITEGREKLVPLVGFVSIQIIHVCFMFPFPLLAH
jgi:uncharacterized UBP type Zn finger protein